MQAPLESEWAENLVNVNGLLLPRRVRSKRVRTSRDRRSKHTNVWTHLFFKLQKWGFHCCWRDKGYDDWSSRQTEWTKLPQKKRKKKCPCTTRRAQRWDNTASCAAWRAEPLWAIGVKRWSQTMISSSNNCFTCGGSSPSPPPPSSLRPNTAHTVLGTK